jgi:hypothetical protein
MSRSPGKVKTHSSKLTDLSLSCFDLETSYRVGQIRLPKSYVPA